MAENNWDPLTQIKNAADTMRSVHCGEHDYKMSHGCHSQGRRGSSTVIDKRDARSRFHLVVEWLILGKNISSLCPNFIIYEMGIINGNWLRWTRGRPNEIHACPAFPRCWNIIKDQDMFAIIFLLPCVTHPAEHIIYVIFGPPISMKVLPCLLFHFNRLGI